LTRALAIGDLNADGVSDLVVGNDGQTVGYLNPGDGHFAEPLVDCSAPPLRTRCLSNLTARSLALGDLDGDAALDLVMGHRAASNLLLNDGAGELTPGALLPDAAAVTSLALGDLNGDGALDLVVSSADAPTLLYLNQGTIAFADGSPFGAAAVTQSLALADLNRDGLLDLALVQAGQGQLYWGDGFGRFAPAANGFGAANVSQRVAVGDLNDDGALDLVAGGPAQGLLYLNQGVGHFATTAVNCAAPPAQVRCFASQGVDQLALADLDGNGTLDLLAAHMLAGVGRRLHRHLNPGDGRLGAGAPLGNATPLVGLAVGDLDGDGDLDLVTVNQQAPGQIYYNDGLGSLALAAEWGGVEATSDLAIGDLNGDGALDLVVGRPLRQNLVYENDGTGRFAAGFAVGGLAHTQRVVLADLNSDGALDLIFGNGDSANPKANSYWLNAGNGRTWRGATFGATGATAVLAVGDLNRDGLPDLVTGGPGAIGAIHLNQVRLPIGLPNHPAMVQLDAPLTNHALGQQRFPQIRQTQVISLPFRLADRQLEPLGQVVAFYSLDGGGQWRPALPAAGVTLTNLATGAGVRSSAPLPLLDAGESSSTLVLGGARPLNELGVTLNLWHGENNQLAASLSAPWPAPTGTQVQLFAGLPGSGNGLLNLTLSDQAAQPLTNVTPTCATFVGNRRQIQLGNYKVYTVTVGRLDDRLLDINVRNLRGTGNFDHPLYLSGPNSPLPFPGPNFADLLKCTTEALGFNFSVDAEASTPLNCHTHDGSTVESKSTDGSLTNFYGENPNGVWTLRIGNNIDNAPFAGELQNWKLELCSWLPITGRYRPLEPLSRLAGAPRDTPITLTIQDNTSGGVGVLDWWALRALGDDYLFPWDTFASGFFGQSDNVVVRLEARPQLAAVSLPGQVRVVDSQPAPQHYAYAAAITAPLRARGTQVRVINQAGAPVSGALVYRRAMGESGRGLPYANVSGLPYVTNGAGYLPGRGALALGDQLMALWPVSATHAFTLYQTSAAPTASGLAWQRVS
jgi:hypothetical protein